jgi:hypothetical protein
MQVLQINYLAVKIWFHRNPSDNRLKMKPLQSFQFQIPKIKSELPEIFQKENQKTSKLFKEKIETFENHFL